MRFGPFSSRRFKIGTGVRGTVSDTAAASRALPTSQRTARHFRRCSARPASTRSFQPAPSSALDSSAAAARRPRRPVHSKPPVSVLPPPGRAPPSRAPSPSRAAFAAPAKKKENPFPVPTFADSARFHPPTTRSSPSPRARPHPTHRRRRRPTRLPRRRCRPWTPACFDRWRSTPPRCSS